MYILYFITLAALAVYSYGAIEKDTTLFARPFVLAGSLSAYIFFFLIVSMALLHWRIVKNYTRYSLGLLGVGTGVILFFSYPFLSHDIFNYLFYARIFTYYGENPFVVAPSLFPGDSLYRLINLPEMPTFYGPSFVLLSAIPSYMSFGNVLLSYVFYKCMVVLFYWLGVYVLGRWNKEWAVFFATSPLVLIEGLVNLHNDLLSTVLAILGLYLILKGRKSWAFIVLVVSGFIKYATLPFLLMVKRKSRVFQYGAIIGVFLVLGYATFLRGMSPWYLLLIFALLPVAFSTIKSYQFFMFGSLLGYVYFVEYGEWRLSFMYLMIYGSLVLNFIYNTTNEFFRELVKKR